MTWSVVRFGKHKGNTLPRIMVDDPEWCFWAADNRVFATSPLASEAREIFDKARRIVIPRKPRSKYEVEYVLDPSTLRLESVAIVLTSQLPAARTATRSDHFDMAFPRSLCPYDKRGSRIMVRAIKRYFF